MAELSYEILFAGVPFLTDAARVVRIHQPHNEQETDQGQAPEKHQPESSLWDEIERLAPTSFIRDISSPSNFMGHNLDAIAIKAPKITPFPFQLNTWFYPTTCSRWSIFRGLVTSAMLKEMLSVTAGNTAQTFSIKSIPISPESRTSSDSNYTISTNMYMLPSRSLGEMGGTFDGLHLVTLVDDRFRLQGTPTTLHITRGTTWATLLTQLATDLGITLTYSTISSVYGVPEPDSQLWASQENAAVLLDAVANNLGRTVCRLMNGNYILRTAAESQAIVDTNRGSVVDVVRTIGGDIFYSGTKLPTGDLFKNKAAICPATLNLTFPKYVNGNDPVPHFVNPRNIPPHPSSWFEGSYGDVHTIAIGIASGGSYVSGVTGVGEHTIQSTSKALYATEAAATGNPLNQSGLTALAMQVGVDHWSHLAARALDETYPGLYNWTPEGLHDIIWTFSSHKRQVTTRVVKTAWNWVLQEVQHSVGISGVDSSPAGVGGHTVPQTWRDQYSGILTAANSYTLAAAMTSGATTATLNQIEYLPTYNRWKGVVSSGATDQEIILFEGTSGVDNKVVDIALRGIDGSLQQAHNNGAGLNWDLVDKVHGVNLGTFGPGYFINPGIYTSGGITEGIVNCPLRTVQVLSMSGLSFPTKVIEHWSGRVMDYDPNANSGSQMVGKEFVWVTERNGRILQSGRFYDGQLSAYSASGQIAPIYQVNAVRDDFDLTVAYVSLTGTYNNYIIPQVSILVITPTAPVVITGMIPPVHIGTVPLIGRQVEIVNAASAPAAGEAPKTISMLNQDTGSSSTNRFKTPDGNPVIISPGEIVKFKYTGDSTTPFWYPAEKPPTPPYTTTAGGGGPGNSSTGTISTGTVNIIPKYTAATTIGNGSITDDGSTIALTTPESIIVNDAATTTTTTELTIGHNSTGTPGAGFGTSIAYQLESSTTANRPAMTDTLTWSVATEGSQLARFTKSVYDNATAREALRLDAATGGANISLFGAGSYGGAVGALFVPDATTAPSTNPSAGVLLYSTGGELTVRDAGGTTTTLSSIANQGGSATTQSWSEAAAIAAAGSTQGTATAITSDNNEVTSITNGSAEGVILPNTVGARILIFNNAGVGKLLKIYPPTGAAINTSSANAAVTLGASTGALLYRVTSTQWYTIPTLT